LEGCGVFCDVTPDTESFTKFFWTTRTWIEITWIEITAQSLCVLSRCPKRLLVCDYKEGAVPLGRAVVPSVGRCPKKAPKGENDRYAYCRRGWWYCRGGKLNTPRRRSNRRPKHEQKSLADKLQKRAEERNCACFWVVVGVMMLGTSLCSIGKGSCECGGYRAGNVGNFRKMMLAYPVVSRSNRVRFGTVEGRFSFFFRGYSNTARVTHRATRLTIILPE
jgi:hypothetical protein